MTTAVLLDDQGKVHHAPTRLVAREGRTYAIIKGLYNGTYALISHKEELSDMKGHWAEAAVNEMASRLVVGGRGAAGFHPNEPDTRAEFVTMLVRSLGLTEQGNTSSFQDVTSGTGMWEPYRRRARTDSSTGMPTGPFAEWLDLQTGGDGYFRKSVKVR